MKTLKQLVVGAGLALALASGAQAQTAAAPPPAAALPVTPAKLALAQSVVNASGAQRTSANLMKSVFGQMSTTMGGAATSPDDRAFISNLLQQETTKMLDRMFQNSAELYAETFTDKELSDLLAFYQSPTGQSLISKQGEIARRALAVVMPMIPQMQKDIVDKMFAHLCEQKKCSPETRAKLEEAKARILQGQAGPATH